jgi:hypothetical protein
VIEGPALKASVPPQADCPAVLFMNEERMRGAAGRAARRVPVNAIAAMRPTLASRPGFRIAADSANLTASLLVVRVHPIDATGSGEGEAEPTSAS